MSTHGSNLASVLFTPVQQRLLGLLFGQPDRWFQSSELIRLVGAGTGAVHRLISRLSASGLVVTEARGNQKHYRANRESPIFAELEGLVRKTVGVRAPIEAALEPLARKIDAAFIYGSVAKASERAGSDIDLLILSDTLAYADLYAALETAEQALGRTINPNVMKRAEWRRKRKAADNFVTRIATQPRTFVIGGPDVAE